MAIENGGTISARQVLAELEPQRLTPLELNRISHRNGAVSKVGQLTRPIRFPLTRIGPWGAGTRADHLPERCQTVFDVITCHRCGEVANTAVRIAELEGDLLCPNGHLPLAEHELLTHVTVPGDYQWLRVPSHIWRARSMRARNRVGTHVTEDALAH